MYGELVTPTLAIMTESLKICISFSTYICIETESIYIALFIATFHRVALAEALPALGIY